jgi:hypothetical protein
MSIQYNMTWHKNRRVSNITSQGQSGWRVKLTIHLHLLLHMVSMSTWTKDKAAEVESWPLASIWCLIWSSVLTSWYTGRGRRVLCFFVSNTSILALQDSGSLCHLVSRRINFTPETSARLTPILPMTRWRHIMAGKEDLHLNLVFTSLISLNITLMPASYALQYLHQYSALPEWLCNVSS